MKTFTRLLNYLTPYKKTILGALICMVLFSLCNIAIIPIVAKMSEAIGNKDFSLLNTVAIIALGIYFLRGFATYGQGYLMNFVGYRVITDLRVKVYTHMQDLSLDFFAKWRTGDIISRLLSDIQTIQSTVVGTIIETTPNILTLFGVLGYLFYLNWRLTLLTLIVIPVLGIFISYFGREMRKVSHHAQSKIADVSSILQEKVAGVRVIKSFAMEKHEVEKFHRENEQNFWAFMKQAQINVTQTPLLAFIQMAAILGLIWYGGLEVVSGRLSPANLIAFFSGIALLADPVSRLGSISISIQGALASADRVFEVIDIKPSVMEKPDAKSLDTIEGKVELRNISFSYEENNEVIKNISFVVNPGETVALVGRSGSGKSTLVNLIPRFYDVKGGEILVDDNDIRDLKIYDLRKFMGIVPQETILFSGTIKDNISYAKTDATNEEIFEVAQMANAHDFIKAFPEGYETLVGERGVRLSGGEKQRVAIARALLRNPKILIFDEATSSLDTESERLVQEAIDLLMKNRTTIVIAHRLSTVQHADKIIVLDQGKIIESGKHEELLAKDGLYKKLYEMQFKI
ncbi:ABC transporter ATP-binding protein [candidate division WOR-1 bacterium RIFOXYC2_FULL_37_10]|uniref:ABC transporter ATP-binding protein n=1 Tax=candidate division WOR-1 bacterium RIFOXYB2_FULL_37_13 TaxID=1802579 RepID=A0A1F4SH28_UNCSA|nr:MAG: ABC transporter ATP-binding protein [candidate division WOR-1 bacterium RIFOXYA2_FULL_37_7]OGC19752.1 MAG: ABC transporter ATP-binding protein [candidate division WOR-1 bacterium RIFOXYB2_FULL_37_13]OGC33182.1 MAG: ABC transporter ATP-binding protein [candidate division WOR-1 bacterium RIFOXYC2_FULL_37_10]